MGNAQETESAEGLRKFEKVCQIIRQAGIQFNNLMPESLDLPLGFKTGAGVIFGTTGGVILDELPPAGHHRTRGDRPSAGQEAPHARQAGHGQLDLILRNSNRACRVRSQPTRHSVWSSALWVLTSKTGNGWVQALAGSSS